MRRFVLLSALPAFLASAPAVAHPGSHTHPHLVEGALIAVMLLVAGGVGALVWARKRK